MYAGTSVSRVYNYIHLRKSDGICIQEQNVAWACLTNMYNNGQVRLLQLYGLRENVCFVVTKVTENVQIFKKRT